MKEVNDELSVHSDKQGDADVNFVGDEGVDYTVDSKNSEYSAGDSTVSDEVSAGVDSGAASAESINTPSEQDLEAENVEESENKTQEINQENTFGDECTDQVVEAGLSDSSSDTAVLSSSGEAIDGEVQERSSVQSDTDSVAELGAQVSSPEPDPESLVDGNDSGTVVVASDLRIPAEKKYLYLPSGNYDGCNNYRVRILFEKYVTEAGSEICMSCDVNPEILPSRSPSMVPQISSHYVFVESKPAEIKVVHKDYSLIGSVSIVDVGGNMGLFDNNSKNFHIRLTLDLGDGQRGFDIRGMFDLVDA